MNVGGSSMIVILIKYGELSTKKGNRNFFINTLYNNVKSKLGMYDVSIHKDRLPAGGGLMAGDVFRQIVDYMNE